MELISPAGSLPALKAAVENGADAVYIGFQDGTNARNFPGLNFTIDEARAAVQYAHEHKARVFLALNTYPTPDRWKMSCAAVDRAVALGFDALILADIGLLNYCARSHPHQRLHLSVQASATNRESIDFYARHFGVRRVILPRVLSLAQVRAVTQSVQVEVEVFGFGSLCVMVEGRCQLSSYTTGVSPNVGGVCSPASAVRWEETAGGRRSRLNGVLVDVYRSGENAAYPTVCKGRFNVGGQVFYAIEEPTSLNVLDILPQLANAGVTALKIEGRQRSPAYVAHVTHIFRAALDAYAVEADRFSPRSEWSAELDRVAEGRCHTLGAYHRPWH